MHINTGRWNEDKLDQLIREAAGISDPGGHIAFISEQFLGTPYQDNTLIGDARTDEELVINLGGMDCFTFIDYVEAMRCSGSFTQLPDILKEVRYRNGIVSFSTRNHFFTDWAEYRPGCITDVTNEITTAVTREKTLNLKQDNSLFIEGIRPHVRTISYIPAPAGITRLQNLKTGDYAGIYSEKAGLDVSHVGIIIRQGASFLLRHASSEKELRKVIDQDLLEYIANKPGLLILRPI